MIEHMVRHYNILSIVGNIITVNVDSTFANQEITTRFGDLAEVEDVNGSESLAQVIKIDGSKVALQVFSGTRGISTAASVRFLGHSMRVTYSANILGRIFNGTGEPMDGGSMLKPDPKVTINGASVNPMKRVLASKMIRTQVPMIDLFNCLVESQKIPIFSISGEPFNAFLARIGIQADADIVVFAGLGLIFDDFHYFRAQFEEAGVFARTVMFCNLA
ncbi:MAG: V-type ATP synthase subunit B, partial [Gammaproteobacteria bacterium HGW-Gammaproteobacteria-10]